MCCSPHQDRESRMMHTWCLGKLSMTAFKELLSSCLGPRLPFPFIRHSFELAWVTQFSPRELLPAWQNNHWTPFLSCQCTGNMLCTICNPTCNWFIAEQGSLETWSAPPKTSKTFEQMGLKEICWKRKSAEGGLSQNNKTPKTGGR